MRVSAFFFSLILLCAALLFIGRAHAALRPISHGKPENRTNRFGARVKRLMRGMLSKKDPHGGTLQNLSRFILLLGSAIVSTAVLEAFAEGLTERFYPFRSLGRAYSIITFLQEVCCGIVLGSIVFLLVRRLIAATFMKRAVCDSGRSTPRTSILCMIALITASVLANNAVRIAAGAAVPGINYPLSTALSSLLAGLFTDTLPLATHMVWGLHIALVLIFINTLPFSTNIHILASLPNRFFSKIENRGTLPPLHAGNGARAEHGAVDYSDLTWKRLLDGYACTGCGTCDEACPPYRSGKPLSPRKIITDIRKRTNEHPHRDGQPPVKVSRKNGSRSTLHGHIMDEELWACTTCMACSDICPVSIEHVDTIVELRRGLVQCKSRIPADVETVFTRLEETGTPYDHPASSRVDWAQGLNIPTLAEHPQHDVLFWVGCAGAFDIRCQKISIAFARLMHHAGVDFAILGSEERCTGDAARRLGNERLAHRLMRENINTFRRYNVKTIVTACPHCFNTLKNEYPLFGGSYTVLHHTEFLDSLLRAGRLVVTHASTDPYTYHDPCYLSRGNGIVESPRNILDAINVAPLTELPSCGNHTLCCGAGGGRMWMDGANRPPIDEELAAAILETECDTIATACPFCLTTLNEGMSAIYPPVRPMIRDIAEILSSAIDEHLKFSHIVRL